MYSVIPLCSDAVDNIGMNTPDSFSALNLPRAAFEEANRISSTMDRALGAAGAQARLRMDKLLGVSDVFQHYLEEMKKNSIASIAREHLMKDSLRLSALHEQASAAAFTSIADIAAKDFTGLSTISDYIENSKSLQATLNSIANPWWEKSAAQLMESMTERERLMQRFAFSEADLTVPKFSLMAHGIAEAAGKEVTLDGALKTILEAIRDAKEPETQKWLWFILVPLIFMLLQAFVNPLADVYVKKWLGESEQESKKQINVRAVEAVGDKSWLSEHRYVARKSLKVTSNASAGSPEVGKLEYGQAVRVVEKRGDFTLVVWTSSDGEGSVRGWVFSRYLKRFS